MMLVDMVGNGVSEMTQVYHFDMLSIHCGLIISEEAVILGKVERKRRRG